MSKPKRPVYKYKIQQFSRKNIHDDTLVSCAYRVLVKDNSSFLNAWLFLTPDGQSCRFTQAIEDAYSHQGFYFEHLNVARECVDKFRELVRKQYESLSFSTISEIEQGVV